MKKLVFLLSMALQGATLLAAEIPSANILCEREDAKDVYLVNGSVQFPNGFEFYGPAMNKFVGKLNFAFADGTENSVAYTEVKGHQIQRARYNEPDFWTFIATSQSGETITLILRTSGYNSELAFGDVERQNGDKYSARCKVEVKLPRTKPPRQYPRADVH